MAQSQKSGGAEEARGQCHRCGWSVPVIKVSRKQAQELHFGRHAALLCDECIDDLKGGELSELNKRLAPVSNNKSKGRHEVA